MVTKFNHGYKLFKPVFCYRFSLCVFPRMAWGNLWKENLLLTLFIYNFTNAAETFFFHSFLCFAYLYTSKGRKSEPVSGILTNDFSPSVLSYHTDHPLILLQTRRTLYGNKIICYILLKISIRS